MDTCSSLSGGAKWIDPEFGSNKSKLLKVK